MQLTPNQRVFLVNEQVIGAAVFNLLINALIGWLTFRGLANVAVWGDPGMALDLTATLFLLPLALCLISTPLVRRAVRIGKVEPIVGQSEHHLVRFFPANLLLRALMLGLVALLLAGPELVLVLRLSNLTQVSLFAFVLCKALLAAVVAGAAAPLVALCVLTEQRSDAAALV